MAGKDGTVRIKYDGDASGLKRANRDAQMEMGKLNKAGTHAMSGLRTAAGLTGIALGVGGLYSVLKDCSTGAMEAEASMNRLDVQLRNLGKNTPTVKKHIDEVVTSLMKMSGFDDEPLRDAFTRILRATKNVGQALGPRGLQLAMDIARAKSIPLATAAEAVAKAQGGSAMALKRLLPVQAASTKQTDALKKKIADLTVEYKTATGPAKENAAAQIAVAKGHLAAAKATDKAQTSGEILKAAQKTFAGQAKKYGDSTAGSMDKMKVSVGNLEETLGAKLNPTIKRAADAITRLSNDPPKGLVTAMTEIGKAVGDATNAFMTFCGWVKSAIDLVDHISKMAIPDWVNKNLLGGGDIIGNLQNQVNRGIIKQNANGSGHAAGAFVRGSYGADDVPVRVTGGEAILNPLQINMLGRENVMGVLGATGAGTIQRGGRYAGGGISAGAYKSRMAGLDARLAIAEGTPSFADDRQILWAESGLMTRRLSTVRSLLRSSKLSRSSRTELLGEEASLIRDRRAIQATARGGNGDGNPADTASDGFDAQRSFDAGRASGLGQLAQSIFAGAGDIGGGGSHMHIDSVSFSNTPRNQRAIAGAGNTGNGIYNRSRSYSARRRVAF
jgi:hypothetical protein